MKPIKKIAGDILLYFYNLKRNNKLDDGHIISFTGFPGNGIKLENKSNLEKDMLQLSDNNDHDVYNALKYLHEKSFIDIKKDSDTGGINMLGLDLTANGIDIIEGIERGEKEKKEFHMTFNIKLAENINIESLIKAELGSLLKASLI